jgi:hypothetical protein
MQLKSICQSHLAALLASPETCACLQVMGITSRTTFVWKLNANHAQPWSYKFDSDDYYNHGDKLLQSINNSRIIPAYSIAELQYVFSLYNYTLVREGKAVQLVIDTPIKISVISETEPDAFAAAIVQLIEQKLATIKEINACIAASNNYSSG